MEKKMIAKVILPLPLDRAFDFFVPDEITAQISVGKRVKVRFQGEERFGIIVAIEGESEHEGPLEPVLEVRREPSFSEETLAFCLRIASDYLAPQGVFINRILPQRISDKKERFFTLAGKVSDLLPHLDKLSCRAPRQAAVLHHLLSVSGPCAEKDLQDELGSVRGALNRLVEKGLIQEAAPSGPVAQEERDESPLWTKELAKAGARGGRTLLFAHARWEGYAHLAKAVLSSGRGALVLAPEILLARQLHTYLQGRVEVRAELYHSGLPEGERGRVWESARRGEARLVIGTRSALFLPLKDLGLLIVDEEQDRSYKQDEMIPHYHARTVATELGEGALVLFGSAAPSLETFHTAESGEITLIRPETAAESPTVRIVNMTKERGPLSEELFTAIERTLDRGRQVLLAVNRRGHFQAVLCKSCGRPLLCPRCGVNLTYDVSATQLVCRLCGMAQPRMVCPECGSRALRFVGVGSARVEEEMKERFPTARIARIDTDTLRTRAQEMRAERALAGEADILVATPMIAKGPVLPQLGLVGAIGVDAILALPDFRAAERTYQYLSGLIGRLPPGGEAIVQTHYHDHIAIRTAACGDYDRFYAMEITERKDLFYPPFSYLARVILTARGATQRRDKGERLVSLLRTFPIEILGPASHPTRRACEVLLLKGRTREAVQKACAAAQQEFPQIEIDLDPVRI
jgi:primosomal protein N' (replication factor Y)